LDKPYEDQGHFCHIFFKGIKMSHKTFMNSASLFTNWEGSLQDNNISPKIITPLTPPEDYDY